MSIAESPLHPTAQEAWQLVEIALAAQDLEEFAEGVLPAVARAMRSSSAFVYVVDPRLPVPRLLQHGLLPEAMSEIESLCAERFDQASSLPPLQLFMASPSPGREATGQVALYPLWAKEGCVGLMGLAADEVSVPTLSAPQEGLFSLLGNAISRLVDRAQLERQLARLNTYLTVSSMLAQELGLHELLVMALYCCMEAVSAETASVLLLDDEKRNFRFYQVEGPTKPVLEAATFPAEEGLAGSVLETQQSEIINDVQSDPRFYGKVDAESGFQTRNMIATPLTAGEERVGVLEVLNKVGGGSFTEEDRLLLLSISEEIAFAIRNAKVFEYVADSYCKQRQGQPSCRGCRRPLGSWTPCLRYREVSV